MKTTRTAGALLLTATTLVGSLLSLSAYAGEPVARPEVQRPSAARPQHGQEPAPEPAITLEPTSASTSVDLDSEPLDEAPSAAPIIERPPGASPPPPPPWEASNPPPESLEDEAHDALRRSVPAFPSPALLADIRAQEHRAKVAIGTGAIITGLGAVALFSGVIVNVGGTVDDGVALAGVGGAAMLGGGVTVGVGIGIGAKAAARKKKLALSPYASPDGTGGGTTVVLRF